MGLKPSYNPPSDSLAMRAGDIKAVSLTSLEDRLEQPKDTPMENWATGYLWDPKNKPKMGL